VVPQTQPAEVCQAGEPLVRNAHDVIDLQRPAHIATRHHTSLIAGNQSGAQMGGDGAPEMAHRSDVDRVQDDRAEDRVGHQRLRRGHRDGTYPCYLRALAGYQVPSHQGTVVDQDLDHGLGVRARGLPVAIPVHGQGHERICRIGLQRLVATLVLGLLDDLLGQGLERGQQHPSRFGGQ